MVNSTVTKADDPSALTQRLAIVEARLGVVESVLRLDVEPVESTPVFVGTPHLRRYFIGLIAMSALVVGLGVWIYLNMEQVPQRAYVEPPETAQAKAADANAERVKAAILNALCYVHHGLPVQSPCVW